MPLHFPPVFEVEEFYRSPLSQHHPPPPRPAVVREESRALELCRARSHFGENEEGKAGRSRMLSLQSRRSTSLSIMIAQQSTWVFDERVGIDGAWLAL